VDPSLQCLPGQTKCGTACCNNATQVCNTHLNACELGTIPGECEETIDGTTCDEGLGVCYEAACKLPENVPCTSGGSFCAAAGYGCNAGSCQDVAECRLGDSKCDTANDYACVGIGGSTQSGAPGTCEDMAECRVGDSKCDDTNDYACIGMGGDTHVGASGTCQIPSLHPHLSSAAFASDCASIQLTGDPGIQSPASYASSTGFIDTICPAGVSGTSTGFSCALSSSHFVPRTNTANWTVQASIGDAVTSPGYVFKTVLSDASLFPLERLMPSAVLGNDSMVGRQPLRSGISSLIGNIGTPHASGGCWGGTTLRGSIALGQYHTCALQADGTVRCWGTNNYGQTNVPTDLGAVVAVDAGGMHTCALRNDNTVHCWGYNSYGQTDVPVDLSAVAIASGEDHNCALRTDGTVRCWGRDSHAQTTVPTDLNAVVAVAASLYHTCALRSDGTVRCWGSTSEPSTVPTDLSAVVAVAAGRWNTCALQSNGMVRCWGWNNNGQTNVPTDLSGVVAVAVGDSHVCALLSNGTVRCWGKSDAGQTTVPADLSAVVAIAAGNENTCALQSNGTVRCWGSNVFGQTNVPANLNAAVQTIGQLSIQQ